MFGKSSLQKITRVVHFLSTCLVIAGLLLVYPSQALADAPPPLPSSFYGEVHISDITPALVTGDQVVAFVGVVEVARTNITLYEGNLVYGINIPATPAVDNSPIIFKVAHGSGVIDRVVATALWHSGTNVNLSLHPPAAQVTYTAPANEGSPVMMDASGSSDWKPDITTYAFNCDGNATYEIGPQAWATTTCTFPDNGTYSVGVKVVDAQGGESTASVSVTVANVAPTLSLTGTSSVDEGALYTLTLGHSDPGADTLTGWSIAWGDGITTTAAGIATAATHTYADGLNTYTITATATDEDGSYSATKAITVNNVAPTLMLTGASSVDEGALYTLTLGHADPGADTLTGWSIDWGDTNTSALAAAVTTATHTYAAGPHSYTITATATDEDGSYSATKDITVGNVAPVVTAGSAASLLQGAIFTGSGSFTDPGTDTWTAKANYGDGSADQILTLTPAKTFSLSHQYFVVGDHTVTVTVNDGITDGTATFTVTVTNVLPTATFTYPAEVNEGSDILLSLSNVFDPGSSVETYTYAFDCGSGTYGSFSTTATDSCPTNNVGSRTVRGKVHDSSGGETEYSATVTITDVPPSAVSAGGPYTADSGSPITLTGTYTCPSVDTCTPAWDLDNKGSFETAGNSVTHTWNLSGSYPVQFRVTDSDGSAVTVSTTVTVNTITHAITLVPGWNLVSFNLQPVNPDPVVVLASLGDRYDLVYAWNAAAQPGQEWLIFDRTVPIGKTLTSLDQKQGFWIYINGTTTVTLSVAGSMPASTTIALVSPGWNLVGLPSSTVKPIDANFSLIYAFHANDTADLWKVYDKNSPTWVNDLTALNPGWGYWIKATNAGSWVVNYP